MSKRWRIATGVALLPLMIGMNACVMTSAISSAGGVSVGSDAQALAANNDPASRRFDASVSSALTGLQSTGQSNAQSIRTFYDEYVAATADYATALKAAADVYTEDSTADPVQARTDYVDNLTHAQRSFLSLIDAAASQLESELTGTHDGVRSTFDDQYSSARNGFIQQQEVTQYEFAHLTQTATSASVF